MKISPTLQKRFDKNTVRDGSGCLLWTGKSVTQGGYGVLSIATGVVKGAHVVGFFLRHGRWPEWLRHTCDNPLCCEADHLLEGTQKQNMADKVARGRQAKGERHGMSKLTDAQVLEIRERRKAGEILRTIATDYNISISNVHQIVTNQTRI